MEARSFDDAMIASVEQNSRMPIRHGAVSSTAQLSQ